jgi:hypothetical protein
MSYVRIKLKDIKQSNCVEYIKKRKELEDNFILQGYDVRKDSIIVGSDNKIINGNHRYCLLLEEYGENHTIIVRKKIITYDIIKFIFIILFIIFFPFFIAHQQIKKSSENELQKD